MIPNFTYNTYPNLPQHLIVACFKLIGLNILKCTCASQCNTKEISNHSRHKPQILQETLHKKKMAWRLFFHTT